jgi:hypothetical protein
MTVDQYALCPCGNGKKIKFCKCKDSLPELDRVMTMIEGRQVVPAIDRLNQVLEEHPDAAWALAIKGRLMIELREYDALAENSARFVRLQPSNPLALSQRAAAEIFHNEPQKATVTLLEALTESGRSVDSFVLDIASLLSYALAQAGLYLTARAYVQLPITAQGYETNQTALMVFQELNTNQGINHLLKSVPEPLPREDDAAWGERFDEAIGLLRSNQILLAESKLQSLARTVPLEPCVLSGLLTCSIWRGDAETQSDCLRKLSECQTLDPQVRARSLALSWLVQPSKAMISVPTLTREADIQNVDEIEAAMNAHSRFAQIDSQVLQQFRRDEESVPPRSAFQILDRDAPESGTKPTAGEYPISLGIVLVYGKQTDRSARVEVLELRPVGQKAAIEILEQALGNLSWQESSDHSISLLETLQPPVAFLGDSPNRRDMASVQRDVMLANLPKYFAHTPLACLGAKTLLEAATDPATLQARTALVRLLEGYEALEDYDDSLLDAVRQMANVAPLTPLQLSSIEEVDAVDAAEIARIDVNSLNTESLLFLFQRAHLLDNGKCIRKAAKRIVALDLEGSTKVAKISAYTKLVEFADSAQEASDLIEEAKAYATANQLDQASLRILELTHKLINGDQAGFSNTLRSISEQYGKRPEVMARVQQLLISAGILRPDGSVRERPGAASGGNVGMASPASGSGIWTPDGGAPASAASPSAPAASKLWIPGMD